MKVISKISLFFILALTLNGCSEDTIDYGGTGKITGRVVEASTFDPIENAKVVLTPSNNTVFTDPEGYFVYEEVAAGDYSVSATKEGFLTGFEGASLTVGIEINIVFEMKIETANNRPPSTPVLHTPNDNSSGQSLSVELKWSSKDPDGDPITYKLKIKNDKNDEELLIESLKDTVYTLTNLKNSTKYFWQVSATDDINPEVWSTTYSFKTSEITENRFLFVKTVNGNNVIFSSDEEGNESAITSDSQNCWRPRKNLTSNKIAFLRTENFETQIYTMNPDGSDLFRVTTIPVNGFKQSELDFSWSSNGAKLIYPHFDKLYEIGKDGSGLRLVYQTPDGSLISECVMNNDDTLIALKTNNSNGYNVSIYTIDMSGNKIDNILSGVNGAAGGLDISVDSKKLLYTYDVSEFESSSYRQLDTRIFVYDFDSDTAKDISEDKPDGTVDLDPKFSPDEAKVIFVNTSNDGISQRNIYIQDIVKDNLISGGNYNREEKFSNAIMPDWE